MEITLDSVGIVVDYFTIVVESPPHAVLLQEAHQFRVFVRAVLNKVVNVIEEGQMNSVKSAHHVITTRRADTSIKMIPL